MKANTPIMRVHPDFFDFVNEESRKNRMSKTDFTRKLLDDMRYLKEGKKKIRWGGRIS